MIEAVWMELLVLLSAGAATTAAGAAVATLRSVYRTERAVFGDFSDFDNGLVGAVTEHEKRLDEHETVLVAMGEYPITDGGERPEDGTEPTTVRGIELPDGAEESDTERDGLLSYASEWHAMLAGAGAGLAAGATGNWEYALIVATAAFGVGAAAWSNGTVKHPTLPALGEVRREPWYACAGLLLGTVLGTVLGRSL